MKIPKSQQLKAITLDARGILGRASMLSFPDLEARSPGVRNNIFLGLRYAGSLFEATRYLSCLSDCTAPSLHSWHAPT